MEGIGNIVNCENPQRVINPYTNEVLYVKCRECESCLEQHTNSWVSRLYDECKLHQYSLFFTLTYDNDNLPYFQPDFYDKDGNLHWSSNRLDDDNELIGNYSFIPVTHSYLECIPYCCRQDVVKFMKRLRSNIHYYFKKKFISTNEKIRYFIVAEYCPSTYRPHYHGILWFDSSEISEIIGKMLHKSWTLCTLELDFSYINGNAPQYVAKYIAKHSNLPKVLRSKSCRVFHLQSKAPAIGYSEIDYEEIQEEIINRTYGRTEYDVATKTPVFIQPAVSLESRYVPKCRQYRFISRIEKLRVYSFALDLERNGIDFRDFPKYHKLNFTSALDIHCSYACYKWCKRYNWTAEMYLDALDDYYYNKDMYLLKIQYEYQHNYVNDLNLPLYHLVDFYPTLFEKLPHLYKDFKHSTLRLFVSTFGIDEKKLYPPNCFHRVIDSEYFDSLHQKHSVFYKNNVSKVHSNFNKMHSKKLKNVISNRYIFS